MEPKIAIKEETLRNILPRGYKSWNQQRFFYRSHLRPLCGYQLEGHLSHLSAVVHAKNSVKDIPDCRKLPVDICTRAGIRHPFRSSLLRTNFLFF